MGYTTDFLGHIDIVPGLNEAEIAYLQAFGGSRRFDRPGGPYEVPANPYAEAQVGRDLGVPMERYNRPAEHFLRPGAEASASGLSAFEEFSFDHVLEGVVVGCRRDTKELFAIRAHENEVTTGTLRAADPKFIDYPPLAYELAIDADREWSAKRKKSGRGSRLKAVGESGE